VQRQRFDAVRLVPALCHLKTTPRRGPVALPLSARALRRVDHRSEADEGLAAAYNLSRQRPEAVQSTDPRRSSVSIARRWGISAWAELGNPSLMPISTTSRWRCDGVGGAGLSRRMDAGTIRRMNVRRISCEGRAGLLPAIVRRCVRNGSLHLAAIMGTGGGRLYAGCITMAKAFLVADRGSSIRRHLEQLKSCRSCVDLIYHRSSVQLERTMRCSGAMTEGEAVVRRPA